jgi:hypothetical protein
LSMPRSSTSSASRRSASARDSFIDTDMAAGVPGDKISPQSVASQIIAALEADAEEVLADPTSEAVKAALPNDLTALYPALQAQWDAEAISR